MKASESQVIELVRTGIGVQEVADRMGIKRYQVEYLKRKNGLQGKFRKQPDRKLVLPTQAEIIQEYGYLAFETTVRGTIICTIDDMSGDEHKGIEGAFKSAYKNLLG
jgi:hypothetical protein